MGVKIYLYLISIVLFFSLSFYIYFVHFKNSFTQNSCWLRAIIFSLFQASAEMLHWFTNAIMNFYKLN